MPPFPRSASRGRTAAVLMAACLAFATLPVSACLIEFDWAAPELSATVSVALTTDTTLPIQEQIKSLEVVLMAGTVEERRQQYAELFADFDQKTNQLFALISDAIRQENEMQLTVVRNLTIAGLAGDVAAQAPSPYSLVFSFADLPDFVLPLECSEACEGSAQSQWDFVRYVPEPAPISLLLASAIAFALVRVKAKPRALRHGVA